MRAENHSCASFLGATLYYASLAVLLPYILEAEITPRRRPASNPVSFHRPAKPYDVTRAGRRLDVGSDKSQAIKRFHEMGCVMPRKPPEHGPPRAFGRPGRTVRLFQWWRARPTPWPRADSVARHMRMRRSHLTGEPFCSYCRAARDPVLTVVYGSPKMDG